MTDLVRCRCVEALTCHFCTLELDQEPPTDLEAWADYVIVHENRHILAHAECAQGQIGVERA